MLITKIYTQKELSEAANELRLGELVAFPTETVYGLGADATNEQAVKRVYLAKGRPSDNPLIVTVCSREMVEEYTGKLPADAVKLMDEFWPGSLTIILKIKPDALSKAVTGGLTTAAFRMPANQVTLELIKEAGVPLVGPSANSSGKPSPTTAQHVFHDLEGRIKGVVDDGPTTVGVESTIVDLSAKKPAVLRPGAVTPEEIAAVLGKEVVSDKHHVGQTEVPKAPGMKYKHYAPDAQVLIVKADQWTDALAWASQQKTKVGVMALDENLAKETLPANVEVFSLGKDVSSASNHLFAGLRYFDDQVDYILCAGVPEVGLGEAYMNRLQKAAGNVYFSSIKKDN
ncbi:Sua5 YciO YrdC YwlC family protein [Ligilactobacillus apodemi DSM 16634 = JCM 16172]|uniref:Threonylcarbamoyl-AMP synthase n=1 Tax=Ligilactobacillus apodemi DSM 16634 = JCM 16172 TaxID=1423724 RepID=A0A0R1TS52_9LACO|nr:L-threonylcarbamoyladenylate synthase [Ligilactobacillus apodemi]KRL84214.1 Sua5 YciO YrdC YwlC family protein [Ligilactobacillus apodemi DSM 16634 = JCM 16172]